MLSFREKQAMIVALAACVVAVVAFARLPDWETVPVPEDSGSVGSPADGDFVYPIYPFDREAFASDARRSEQDPPFAFGGAISGAIIPHHTLPGVLLSGFFRELSKRDPMTIILIGPNHPDAGRSRVLTSPAPWETPFGRVENDADKTEAILGLPIAGTDEPVLSKEHSIAGVLPFVKYFLPDAKIVPVVLDSRLTRSDIALLSGTIARISDERTVVVAAVDFSHYLPAHTAEEKDRETEPLLRGFRTDEILRLGNDHVDSPTSIAVFLETMKDLGATDMDLLANTNSGRIASDDRAPSTSYFFAGFSRKGE